MMIRQSALLLLSLPGAAGFSTSRSCYGSTLTTTVAFARPSSLPPLASSGVALLTSKREDDTISAAAETRGSAVDPAVRSKLLAESIAPWRTIRLFLYAALGSGAALGGFITASGVAAALSGVRSDVDLNTEYLNLAIDFGAVAAFAVLAKYDLDKSAELNENVEKKLERKKEQKEIASYMRKREEKLSGLEVNVRVSEGGATKKATVGVMQSGAKQHVILVAGPTKAIKDALRGAQLNRMNFAMSNVLVVPYDTSDDKAIKPSGGFAERPSYETQPYVAEACGEGWDEYISSEMEDAVKQGGEKAREEGIAIVLANNGKVIRRGVGKVPWRQMVDQLEEEVTGEEKSAGVPFLEYFE